MTEWRAAGFDDLPAIIALLADDVLGAGRESADLTRYRRAFAALQAEPDNMLIVGVRDGRVIACYQLTLATGLALAGMRRATLEGVRVHGDLRGLGMGAQLIADAEARARALGAGLIQLTSDATRHDAQRFYARAGYRPSHIGFKKRL